MFSFVSFNKISLVSVLLFSPFSISVEFINEMNFSPYFVHFPTFRAMLDYDLNILQMGHIQPITPVITDNTTANKFLIIAQNNEGLKPWI